MKSRYSDETAELCACETPVEGHQARRNATDPASAFDVMMSRGHQCDVPVVRGDRSAAFACRRYHTRRNGICVAPASFWRARNQVPRRLRFDFDGVIRSSLAWFEYGSGPSSTPGRGAVEILGDNDDTGTR